MTATPKVKGVQVEFSNGTTMTVPPLNLAAVETLQDRLATFKGGMDKESVALMVDATLLALKRNYPDMTRDQVVNDLLDLGNMEEVMQAVMDVSGLRRKEQEQALGEAQAGKAI
jgi:hypothetical protein